MRVEARAAGVGHRSGNAIVIVMMGVRLGMDEAGCRARGLTTRIGDAIKLP